MRDIKSLEPGDIVRHKQGTGTLEVTHVTTVLNVNSDGEIAERSTLRLICHCCQQELTSQPGSMYELVEGE